MSADKFIAGTHFHAAILHIFSDDASDVGDGIASQHFIDDARDDQRLIEYSAAGRRFSAKYRAVHPRSAATVSRPARSIVRPRPRASVSVIRASADIGADRLAEQIIPRMGKSLVRQGIDILVDILVRLGERSEVGALQYLFYPCDEFLSIL